MTQPSALHTVRHINNGRIWYTAVMPLLAMYIQSYATNAVLGALVWTATAAMCVISLIFDRRYLEREGIDIGSLSPFLALLPPIYMYKRFRILGMQSAAPIVWAMIFAFALYANGFTRYYMLDNNAYAEFVKLKKWTDIVAVKNEIGDKEIDREISKSLRAYAKTFSEDAKVEWTVEHSGKTTKVTAACEKAKFTAEFEFDYDGFGASDTYLKKLTLDGKTYKNKDAAKKITAILEKLPNDSSSSQADKNSSSKKDKDSSSDSKK